MAKPNPLQDKTILMIQRLLSGPSRPGQTFTMPDCNYDELYRTARRINALFDRTRKDDPPVCLCCEDRATIAAAMLASLAGGPQLLLPHALSAASLLELHRLTGFTRAIAKTADLLPAGVTLVEVDALTEEVESWPVEAEADPDRPWVHLFTGGTTGTPRMWSKTPRNLLGEVDYLINRYGIGSGDRFLATIPPLHIYGLLYSLLVPLAASARVAAATPSFPEEIKRLAAETSPTILVSVPVHYRALKTHPLEKGDLRLAFSSGGPLAEADGLAFSGATGVDLVEVYGSTETGGIATRCRAKGESGFTPYDCIQWRLAGDDLDVRSDFLSKELPVRSSGWFTVADRVAAHEGSGFLVTGRTDHIVKVGGNRVDLEKIRQAILDLDGVDDALVMAQPVQTGREQELVALVVGGVSCDQIQRMLDQTLEPHEKPRRMYAVDRIPMAATGKVDRRALETLTVDRHVKFEPAGLRVPLDRDKTIQALGGDHGIDIRADCGGMGVCGKCRILADPKENLTPPTIAELDLLTPEQASAGSRLACQTRAVGPATVTIPDALAENTEARGKTGIGGSFPVDPTIRRLTAENRSPGLKTDNHPESLVDWLATQVGQSNVSKMDATALRRLSNYHGSLNTFTVVVHEETGIRRILEGRQAASLGLAVDLGTTSVAGYLCDLKTGLLLAADACVNPQRRFGEDVISRISHINEKKPHLEGLQRLAAEGINFILTRCLERVGATIEEVDEVAVCGNTTMEQILAGFHPRGLGVFPYFPLTLTPPVFSAGDLGLAPDPAVPVFLMPVVSGFVGGDTMAAILADRPHERDEITLIVDIGTNGEVVLGSREGLWVTSCATGPALEGAQISCGMRAATGAIHRFWTDANSRRIAYEVLGDPGSRPMGICGSGIIDAIAVLRRIGAILPNGRLNEKDAGVSSDEKGVGRHYTIAGGDQSATGSDIRVTLKDIRQIQLAKGALSTGIQFLMRRAGITHIDRTVLTGAFGARFNWKNALAIGMLPPQVAQGQVVSKENLAGVGVVMTLLDKRLRSEAHNLCRRVRYLELASEPDFAMAFAQATAFPEVDGR